MSIQIMNVLYINIGLFNDSLYINRLFLSFPRVQTAQNPEYLALAVNRNKQKRWKYAIFRRFPYYPKQIFGAIRHDSRFCVGEKAAHPIRMTECAAFHITFVCICICYSPNCSAMFLPPYIMRTMFTTLALSSG